MLKLYNTLTRQKEPFKPKRQDNVKVYFCGPTVYNYAHIGNLRAYVFEDLIIKTLRFLGYNVSTLMNITDIDDKTIRDSQKAGEKLKEFTEKYTRIFLEDIEKIGITKADKVVPISNLIDEMVRMINTMIKKGYAYIGDDNSIYFDISKFKDYGKLAHLDFSGLKSSVRIDNDEYDKESASDFVLWKAWKQEDGENFWEKSFSIPAKVGIYKKDSDNLIDTRVKHENDNIVTIKGRPGWHIECSACNMVHFGPEIDIHMGGVDLIFPHHQNEIAQTEAVTGKQFCKYWLHSGHLMVDGKKMSKSLGNFYTLKDLEEKYKDKLKDGVFYRAFRLGFINGKYADSIDFSFSKLEQNFRVIEKLDETIKKLEFVKASLKSEKGSSFQKGGVLKVNGIRREFRENMQNFISEFIEYLEDDFNFVEAIAGFHSFLTFVNKEIDKLTLEEHLAIIDMFKTYNQVLGIVKFDFEEEKIPDEILQKLEMRNTAKKEKNFILADALRDELDVLGYKIIDSREGSRLEKK